MNKINRNQFQSFPYHLVDPSPWPILVSFSLLNLTLGAVMYMQGFTYGGQLLSLGFTLTGFGMILWFRDIITEGTRKYIYPLSFISFIFIVKVISKEIIKNLFSQYEGIEQSKFTSKEEFGYYLAGLLEGDGSIDLPSIGKTSLNRILNPRIVFTSHINNLEMYLYIYNQLGGRFQVRGNTLRFIIGNIAGIKLIINLIHGKLRTPKNIRFNPLIEFLNNKYDSNIRQSSLNRSDLYSNSWLTGFIEADGHFGVKTVKRNLTKSLPSTTLSELNKDREIITKNISLVFRLDQRAHDIPTNSSMEPLMENLAHQLNCNLLTFSNIPNRKTNELRKVYSVGLTSPIKLLPLIEYLNKYKLLGNKYKDFKDWQKFIIWFFLKNIWQLQVI
jgi:LAGLIDADG endonuclease/Cytochrome c oxidase subunit III